MATDIIQADFAELRILSLQANTEAAKQCLSDNATLLKALKHLQDNGPAYPSSGVCYNVGRYLGVNGAHQIYVQCIHLTGKWPNRQLDCHLHWPVAGNCEPLGDPAYDAWDVNTENGQRRRALLRWMIDTLTKELQHENGDVV